MKIQLIFGGVFMSTGGSIFTAILCAGRHKSTERRARNSRAVPIPTRAPLQASDEVTMQSLSTLDLKTTLLLIATAILGAACANSTKRMTRLPETPSSSTARNAPGAVVLFRVAVDYQGQNMQAP